MTIVYEMLGFASLAFLIVGIGILIARKVRRDGVELEQLRREIDDLTD